MYAGKNLRALLDEMHYSVARLVAGLGGTIPQARIESWLKGLGAPKSTDTQIICDFFKISSEDFHKRLFTEEEVKTIVKGKKLNNQQADKNKSSNITQSITEGADVHYLQDKISMLERLLDEKERFIEFLLKKTNNSELQKINS